MTDLILHHLVFSFLNNLHFFHSRFEMSYNSETRLSRQRQITTLKVFNENVEEILEGSEYKVKFQSYSLPLALIVKLPPDFPDCPPLIFCSPPVLHPWLTGGRVSNAPGLLNFTPHSDLGMVVTAIRRELEKNQLSVQPNISPINTEYQPQPTSSDLVRSKLAELNKEELQDILNNEGALDKFMDELSYPPLDSINDNIKSMEENIKATAENNIDLQNQIESYRDSLLCKVEEYHTRKSELEVVFAQLDELKNRVDGGVLADQLVRLSVNNEEESDRIADKFLSKELPVEKFLQDYIKTRQDCHVQKIKADKVKKL